MVLEFEEGDFQFVDVYLKNDKYSIIEGIFVQDFKFCKCRAVVVDSGYDYLKICGNREDWEELSEIEKNFV